MLTTFTTQKRNCMVYVLYEHAWSRTFFFCLVGGFLEKKNLNAVAYPCALVHDMRALTQPFLFGHGSFLALLAGPGIRGVRECPC